MERIKFILGSLFGTLVLLPALAFAQAGNLPASNGLSDFLVWLQRIMNMVVPILIGLAVIVFLWGVLVFIFNASDDEKRKSGKWLMIYGIIGIVVMVSVWGLVGFVQNTFGLQDTNSHNNVPVLPQV